MSTGLIIAIAVGGSVLVLGGILALVLWLRRSYDASEQARSERLGQALSQYGWRFEERNDAYVQMFNELQQYASRDWMNPLTPDARAANARNIITGMHRGRPFLAAEFGVYYKQQYNATRCIWVRTPTAKPALSVTRVLRVQSAISGAIGQADVRVGDPEFDQNFEASTQDEQFGRAVLTPELVRFLKEDPRQPHGFKVVGNQLDVFDRVADYRDPADLIPALDLRCDILDLIPQSVWAR